jgi:hypothetical protein
VLTKEPIVAPSFVMKSFIVGFIEVAQQIPLEIIAFSPSEVIFPPETAPVRVIEEIAAVVRIGSCAGFTENESSFPYAVPAIFVA